MITLFRRKKGYLAANPAGVLQTNNNSNNSHRDKTNANPRGSPAKPEREEQGRNKQKDASTLRNRRRTRRTPSARRSQSRAGTGTATPASCEESNVLPVGGATSTGRSGACEASGGASASNALGRGRVSGRAGAGTAGTSAAKDGASEGLSAATTATATTTAPAPAAAAAPAAGVKVGRRKSAKGSRNRTESKMETFKESGGDGMESVSLTASVEVTVLNGISVGEDRERNSSSSGGGDRGVDGYDEAACGSKDSNTGGQQRLSTAVSDGVELPPLKHHQQPRGSTANFIHAAAGVDGREREKAEKRGTGLVAGRSPSAAASSVSRECVAEPVETSIPKQAGARCPTGVQRREESPVTMNGVGRAQTRGGFRSCGWWIRSVPTRRALKPS